MTRHPVTKQLFHHVDHRRTTHCCTLGILLRYLNKELLTFFDSCRELRLQ